MNILIFILVAAVFALGIVMLVHALKKSPGPGPAASDLKRALVIIWNQIYDMHDSLPTIRWVTGTDLNCAKGTGWMDKFDGCVAGLSWPDSKMMLVAWYLGLKISDSALAHELCHHYLYRTGQDPDSGHTGPAFAAGGIKDRANAALKAAGL
jgi:hypothetical protein